MKEEISRLLKIIFIIHFFVAVIFGLVLTFIVEGYVLLVGWHYLDPISGRVLGAVFLGFATSSLLCWRETKWESAKIVVQMEIVWLAIGIAVHILSIFLFLVSFMIFVQTGILIFFLVAFAYAYYDQEWGK